MTDTIGRGNAASGSRCRMEELELGRDRTDDVLPPTVTAPPDDAKRVPTVFASVEPDLL